MHIHASVNKYMQSLREEVQMSSRMRLNTCTLAVSVLPSWSPPPRHCYMNHELSFTAVQSLYFFISIIFSRSWDWSRRTLLKNIEPIPACISASVRWKAFSSIRKSYMLYITSLKKQWGPKAENDLQKLTRNISQTSMDSSSDYRTKKCLWRCPSFESLFKLCYDLPPK